MKKIAVSCLHLPDGRILNNQVIVFSNGKAVRIYPLTKEEPCTSWFGSDFFLQREELQEGV